MKKSSDSKISLQLLRRMPDYYNYLREVTAKEETYISSAVMANDMSLSEVQVRKDLASVCKTPGTPRKGFLVADLVEGIGDYLGYNNQEDVILVGVGLLGRALLLYDGFREYGMNIVAAFDSDKKVIGNEIGGKKVFHTEKLPSLRKRLGVQIGIITAPASEAQEVCDALVESGISAVWNFAPVHLRVPSEVIVRNENLAPSLALLAQELNNKTQQKE